MLKKFLAAVGTAALALGMATAASLPAAASEVPNASVTADCSALAVSLSGYSGEGNSVQVWTDGSQVADATFADAFSGGYGFAAAASHTYRVVVDAVDDAADSDSGTLSISDCEVEQQELQKVSDEIVEEEIPEHVDVTLCHWTQADKWNAPQTIDDDAAFNAGHLDPSKSDTHNFDIIKPFTYSDGTYFPGKNWEGGNNEAEYKDSFPFNGYTGEQIMDNGCEVPEPELEELVPQYSHQDQQCRDEQYVDGSISVTLHSAIEWKLEGPAPAHTPIALVAGSAGGLAPGTYFLTATDAHDDDDYEVQEFVDKEIVIDPYDGLCGDLPTQPTVDAFVSSTPLTCEADGSYKLSDNAEFTEEHPGPAVTWTVDGNPSDDGTFPVTGPGTVKILVEVNGPDWGWNDPEQQTEWELVFTAPTGCDLETLALTGVDDATPALTLAGFLGLLGAAMVRSSRRLGRERI